MSVGTQNDSEIELSIVTTMYYSAPYLAEFCRRVGVEAEKLTPLYEIILVNDGSPDASLDEALRLQQRYPQIRIVDLSRNFGQHKAMMTGFEHARGRLIFLIDCDLEEDPELLGLFHEEMHASGADVIYGVQSRRHGSWFKRFSGDLFYTVFEFFSNFPIPSNPLNARLMTRRYLDSLLKHEEREIYMAGLWALTGYKQVPLKVIKHARANSTYTLLKRLIVAVEAIVSFSTRPLYGIFLLGTLIMLISGSSAIWLIANHLFFQSYMTGWTSLIVSIWLLGGLTIFSLGILGIYLSKVLMESKHRPRSLVRACYERGKTNEVQSSSADDVYNRIDYGHIDDGRSRPIAYVTRSSGEYSESNAAGEMK